MILTLSNKSKNQVINETIRILAAGGLVVFPTDTVYGLFVDSTNGDAVQKLIQFKNRPPGKAISVLVSDMDHLARQVELDSGQRNILEEMLPGPFTVILPSRHNVVADLESEKGTLGVRIPDNDLVRTLARQFGKPITATSANLGGRSPHYSIDSLLHQIPENKKKLIDLIVDAGKLPHNKPSTVIDLTTDQMTVLRQGDIVLNDTQTFISHSPEQTRTVGESIAANIATSSSKRSTVVILKGDLGAGKTEMTRGIAGYFGVEKVVSPTFVIYYEYDILISDNRHPDRSGPACRQAGGSLNMKKYNKFIHVDLYNIQEEAEFEHLGLEAYMNDTNVMVIEWGEKLGKWYETFRKVANVVFVEIEYISAGERKIRVSPQQ